MKIKTLLFVIFNLFAMSANAQSFPITQSESSSIQDVLFQDNGAYYATWYGLYFIDENGQKNVIEGRFIDQACKDGEFTSIDGGWIYLGWNYFSIDQGLPNLLIRKYDNQQLIEKEINLFDEYYGTFISATYQSDDLIYILHDANQGYLLHKVNIEGEIMEVIDLAEDFNLDIYQLNKMILLEDNLNLLVDYSKLSTISNQIVNQKSFEEQIIDVKYYEEGRIEVLTESKLFVLKASLEILKETSIPDNGRESLAAFTAENITYLIEHGENESFVSSISQDGAIISEFIELPGIHYTNMQVTDNQFAIWGRTNCPGQNYVLKIDESGVDATIETVDLSISDFQIQNDSIVMDTIFFEGNEFIFEKAYFSWEVNVSNQGQNTVDKYRIFTSVLSFNMPRFIDIIIDEPLMSGESRTHIGTFSYEVSTYNFDDVTIWISPFSIENNCSNNRDTGDLILTSQDVFPSDIVIYPNPTTDILNIKGIDSFDYRIFNSHGKIIAESFSKTYNSIDIQDIPPGIYYIEIKSYEVNGVKQFIKL